MTEPRYIDATRSRSPRIAEHTVLATAADAYTPPPANKDDNALVKRMFRARPLQNPTPPPTIRT